MELRGGIEVTFQGYVLKSEEANYLPAKDQIVLPSRTTVVGEGISLEGARMEVEFEGEKNSHDSCGQDQDRARKVGKKKNVASANAGSGDR